MQQKLSHIVFFISIGYLAFSLLRVWAYDQVPKNFTIDIAVSWGAIFLFLSCQTIYFISAENTVNLDVLVGLIFPVFDTWNLSQAYKKEKVALKKTVVFRFVAIVLMVIIYGIS